MGRTRGFRTQLLGAGAVLAPVLAWASPLPTVEFPAGVVAPPMTVPTARFFSTHPASFSAFVARLPQPAAPDGHRFVTASGGTWQKVTDGPAGLCNPLLLTDGTVMAAVCNTPAWYKLTPDITGSYAHGTWTQVASLPVVEGVQYAPQYHASGVLPDGRVIIEGGEYDGHNKGVWTNQGAIYDPVANTWTGVLPPLGSAWTMIGDAQSTVLADGTFMLASCCAYHPAADALLNAKTLNWSGTGAPRFGGAYQDEQGYELLPSGEVLTIDVWTASLKTNPTNAEKYEPGPRKWFSAGTMPVSLVDPVQCGNFEIGPAVLRGDGTVVAFGGNTGCVARATADPTAIYASKTGSWSAGPNVPAACGADGSTSCSLADAPAALLPDGNILFAASAGYGTMPTHFFEFGADNTITQVSDTVLHAAASGAYYYNFLVLPNGQILSTDFSKTAEVYTPAGAPVSGWAPVVYKAPSRVSAGKTYQIVGAQLSGRSQGAYYGDDVQAATNYPIVRITNLGTGHVFYGRTSKISSVSVAQGALSSANVTVPAGIETGASTLVVVANGIASQPSLVTVE